MVSCSETAGRRLARVTYDFCRATGSGAQASPRPPR
jgi:hypothetical protein